MNLIKFSLLPFSFLYGLITDFRNYCYDKAWWHETVFNIPIINVGNLTVGGTGKTPHVEYLIRLLSNHFSIVTLSRGYGRKTKGYILADSKADARSIGDEPYQFYQKFKQKIDVAVGENRVGAISKILSQKVKTEIIILDDAFQHRAIKPSLNILLMDFNRPIFEDYVFPAGRLRERRWGAKRADVVVVTKCPVEFTPKNQLSLNHKLQTYLRKNTPIFYTKIKYGKPINCRFEKEAIALKEVVLLSGIANPKPFEDYAKGKFKVFNHLIFKDHHDYKEEDINEMIAQNDFKAKVILMTEKDMVKFKPLLNHPLLRDVPLYYLPIEIEFLDANMQKVFDKFIFQGLNEIRKR